jgi:hypothetical protein
MRWPAKGERNDEGIGSGFNHRVLAYALDPDSAEALWKKSEELVGESF